MVGSSADGGIEEPGILRRMPSRMEGLAAFGAGIPGVLTPLSWWTSWARNTCWVMA